jgi:hypothetical protein
MRRPILAVLLAGAALLAAPRAGATPHSDHFEDLLAELNLRDGDLPLEDLTPEQRRERATLRKAFAALRIDSDGLADDLRIGVRIAAPLEKGYPGDGEIGALLDGALDGLAGDVGVVHDEVVVAIGVAAEGRVRDRAEAKRVAAALVLEEAPFLVPRLSRARAHDRAHRLLLAANALALRAGPGGSDTGSSMAAFVDAEAWAANPDFGTAVGGIAEVDSGSGQARKVIVFGRRVLPKAGSPGIAGASTRLQITLMANPANLAPGTYSLGTTDGIYLSANWTEEDEDGDFRTFLPLAGTLTLETLEVNAGSVDVSGTFSFSMFHAPTEETLSITSGSFEAPGLPRTAAIGE